MIFFNAFGHDSQLHANSANSLEALLLNIGRKTCSRIFQSTNVKQEPSTYLQMFLYAHDCHSCISVLVFRHYRLDCCGDLARKPSFQVSAIYSTLTISNFDLQFEFCWDNITTWAPHLRFSTAVSSRASPL